MNSLVTVEVFDRSFEAQIAKLALEQAGIQSFLANETLVSMDWFMANAVGGIQLQVSSEDAAQASNILAEIRARHQDHQDTEAELNATPHPSPLLHNSLYLVCEIVFVLCLAYFLDLYYAFELFRYVQETQADLIVREDEISMQLLWRSAFVLVAMVPILILHGVPRGRIAGEEHPAKPRSLVQDLMAGVGLFAIAFAIQTILLRIIPMPTFSVRTEWPRGLTSLEHLRLCILLVIAAITNSLAEELVMRAYMIDRLQRLFGSDWGAVLFAAVLFGSYHIYQGLAIGFATATLIGIALGVYFIKTRRLAPLVAAHTLYNLTRAILDYAFYS